MKEPYGQESATQSGAEPSVSIREGRSATLSGVRTDRVLGLHARSIPGGHAVEECGSVRSPRRDGDIKPARTPSQTPCVYRNTLGENRPASCTGAVDGAVAVRASQGAGQGKDQRCLP
jgi:hypothetical protein